MSFVFGAAITVLNAYFAIYYRQEKTYMPLANAFCAGSGAVVLFALVMG